MKRLVSAAAYLAAVVFRYDMKRPAVDDVVDEARGV
eukprot:CAMPEP_0118851000 /NCGR_PEP_ID=MMETSP1163-20130328/601_1 /TAXON_ID=124430 /ORGANISM="Phaeomonas parva, Strain CCMP2877" /LENGTH=35 /DNA_ID= /DNA_START= /DNA_END= /DNA_ORIENTATION=